jgi:RNA polymerase sigma-70 factor (ECF subfamily)
LADSPSTCWTVIEAAAAGLREEREHFARRYAPIVRSYLAARWRGLNVFEEVEDAVQEVFLECFKRGGILEKAERGRPGGFRAFLYGATRHVALRFEERRAIDHARRAGSDVKLDEIPGADLDHSLEFDRAWAKTILREAREKQAEHAAALGDAALKRVELLRLRFREGLPIREIARRWETAADRLHEEYARARNEFRSALREVVVFHHPGTAAEVERECESLLALFA